MAEPDWHSISMGLLCDESTSSVIVKLQCVPIALHKNYDVPIGGPTAIHSRQIHSPKIHLLRIYATQIHPQISSNIPFHCVRTVLLSLLAVVNRVK